LLGRLGAGGMGRVYLARSAGGRTVAVKVVHEEHIANGEFRARFRREIEAARRVGGRYTAPVLDADADAERPWVATGYVPGPSLEQAVREHGPLPAASVNALADGLLRALRGIHAAGIVHRDLKPSNVLLTVDGPRVIDFGIARALQVSVESLLTSTGMVIGSPGFMAPEQILGEETGAGADVFSLGCVLMYAATGRLPFGAGASNQHAVMFRIVQSPPDLDAVEDASLRELIERCLIKNAAERPGVDELLEGLEPARSADALKGAWLPPVLLARLAQQSALLLDADVPEARADGPEALDVPAVVDVPAAVDVPEEVESAGAEGGEEPASPVVPEPREPEPRDLGTVDLRPAPVTGDDAGGSSPASDPARPPLPNRLVPPTLPTLPFRKSRVPETGHGIGVGGVPGSLPLPSSPCWSPGAPPRSSTVTPAAPTPGAERPAPRPPPVTAPPATRPPPPGRTTARTARTVRTARTARKAAGRTRRRGRTRKARTRGRAAATPAVGRTPAAATVPLPAGESSAT
ncbi:Serine/threonine protein kinase, partial [Streptomyces sp. Ncost-T6T-2b]